MEKFSNYFFNFSKEYFECIMEHSDVNEILLQQNKVFYRRMLGLLIIDQFYCLFLAEKKLLVLDDISDQELILINKLSTSKEYKAFLKLLVKFVVMQDQIFGSNFALYKSWSIGQTKHSDYLVFINPFNLIRVQRVAQLNKKKLLVVLDSHAGELNFLKIRKPNNREKNKAIQNKQYNFQNQYY